MLSNSSVRSFVLVLFSSHEGMWLIPSRSEDFRTMSLSHSTHLFRLCQKVLVTKPRTLSYEILFQLARCMNDRMPLKLNLGSLYV